ncbi:MAG: aldehyde dehydrogenase, partial [Methylococcales bacterium]
MIYAAPNQPDSKVNFKPRYENFIGGNWVAPVDGEYFENISPINGKSFCEIPRSTFKDVELALDA